MSTNKCEVECIKSIMNKKYFTMISVTHKIYNYLTIIILSSFVKLVQILYIQNSVVIVKQYYVKTVRGSRNNNIFM